MDGHKLDSGGDDHCEPRPDERAPDVDRADELDSLAEQPDGGEPHQDLTDLDLKALYDDLGRYARSLGLHTSGEDLVQATVLRIYETAKRTRIRHLRALSRYILWHFWIDGIRRDRRRRECALEDAHGAEGDTHPEVRKVESAYLAALVRLILAAVRGRPHLAGETDETARRKVLALASTEDELDALAEDLEVTPANVKKAGTDLFWQAAFRVVGLWIPLVQELAPDILTPLQVLVLERSHDDQGRRRYGMGLVKQLAEHAPGVEPVLTAVNVNAIRREAERVARAGLKRLICAELGLAF